MLELKEKLPLMVSFLNTNGKKFSIVGRICMDLTLVDVGSENISVGDEAVLIGTQGKAEISADDMIKLLR